MRLLCATVLALSSAAASEPTIVVEGNRRIDAQAIREHFHASSEGLTPAAIDAALKELYRTGLFEDVNIIRSGTRLIVTVVEAPLIEHLRFEGNKQVKDKDLANEIGLKPRSAMTNGA
jgi:outer membrane protein insertion porin family